MVETKENLYSQLNAHLLEDEEPSYFLNSISNEPLFDRAPFAILERQKDTKQSPKYHPEGSVWNHTLMVVDAAANVRNKSKNSRVFMWAAFLHDIGKPDTTRNRNGKITSYNHETLGADMARKFLHEFKESDVFIDQVTSLVRWHMQILFVVKDMPFADTRAMKQQSDVEEVALLGLCDRLGRLGANPKEEERNIELFLKKCKDFGM